MATDNPPFPRRNSSISIARIFGFASAALGLIADAITIITYVSTIAPSPVSSGFSLSTIAIIAISFTLFYGWLVLSYVLTASVLSNNPQKSVKYTALSSTFVVGILIWPILTTFLYGMLVQFKLLANNPLSLSEEIILLPILIQLLLGFLFTSVIWAFIWLFD